MFVYYRHKNNSFIPVLPDKQLISEAKQTLVDWIITSALKK
jgi:hypothetical protein